MTSREHLADAIRALYDATNLDTLEEQIRNAPGDTEYERARVEALWTRFRELDAARADALERSLR